MFAKGAKMPGSDGLLLVKKNSTTAKKLLHTDFAKQKGILKFVNDIKNIVYSNSTEKAQGNFLFTPFGLFIKLFIPLENMFKSAMFADDKCTHCRICEKVCPVNNINVTENEVLFSKECVLCLRCITQCPVEAIQISRFTKDTVRWRGPTGNFNPLKKDC